MSEGVHTAHCCTRHGCKYGKDDCPVELGTVKQEFPCEFCGQLIEVDPTELLPGDVVVAVSDHDISGCHCDVRLTVKRGTGE
jgi:hypothetical protein